MKYLSEIQIVMIAFIVTSITFTICVTSIFKWLREWVSTIHPKLEELIHCPYCLGHYVSLGVLALTGVYEFTSVWIVNYLLTVFCVMGLVSIMHHATLRAYKPIAEAMMHRDIERIKNLKQSNNG